jgi:hypothetical protein
MRPPRRGGGVGPTGHVADDRAPSRKSLDTSAGSGIVTFDASGFVETDDEVPDTAP